MQLFINAINLQSVPIVILMISRGYQMSLTAKQPLNLYGKQKGL